MSLTLNHTSGLNYSHEALHTYISNEQARANAHEAKTSWHKVNSIDLAHRQADTVQRGTKTIKTGDISMKIGEFAQAAGLPISALRHYDKEVLLKQAGISFPWVLPLQYRWRISICPLKTTKPSSANGRLSENMRRKKTSLRMSG